MYPAVHSVSSRDVGRGGRAASRRRAGEGGGTTSTTSRPYRAGDEPHLIHWPTTAKSGSLMVRELEEDTTEDTRIVLTGTGAADGGAPRASALGGGVARPPPPPPRHRRGAGGRRGVRPARPGPGPGTAHPDGARPLRTAGPAERGTGAGAAACVRSASPWTRPDGDAAPSPDRALPPRRGRAVRALPGRVPRPARRAPRAGLLVATWLVQPRGARSRPDGSLGGPAARADGRARARWWTWLYLAENVLDALVRLLLFLVLYKLATLRSVKETRTIAFLAFFMLVASSGSAFGVGFLFAFVGFVALLSWIALLQHVASEAAGRPGRRGRARAHPVARRAGGRRGRVDVRRGRRPLLRAAAGRARDPAAPRAAGADDDGLLRAGGARDVREHPHRLERRDARAPAGRGPARPAPEPPLAGRGAGHVRRPGLERPAPAPDAAGPGQRGAGSTWASCAGAARFLRQEVFLEPIASEAVFAAPRVLRVTMPASTVAMDDMGAVSVVLARVPGSGTRSSPSSKGRWSAGWATARPAPPLSVLQLERYLQLPALPPAIPALARQVAGRQRRPGRDREPRGGVPAGAAVPLHARHRAGEPARPAPGVPPRPPGRALRVLRGVDGGHAAEPRRARAGRQRLPARGVESLRPVLHRAVLRRALVGRGLRARRRVDELRSHAARHGRRARRPDADAALPRLPPAPVAPLRGELEPARPDPRGPVGAARARGPARLLGAARSGDARARSAARARCARRWRGRRRRRLGRLAAPSGRGPAGERRPPAFYRRALRAAARRGLRPGVGGDRAGVQRSRRRARARGGGSLHARDDALRARALRRGSAEPRGRRGRRRFAGRPRAARAARLPSVRLSRRLLRPRIE